MTYKMAMVKRHGLMLVSIKVSIKTERNMVWEPTYGPMAHHMLEIGWPIRLMVKESIDGWMEESTMENGQIITCMDMVFILGKTDVSTKVNISKIKSMVREHIPGQMVAPIQVDGNTDVNMVRGHTNCPLEPNVKVFGSKANDLNG